MVRLVGRAPRRGAVVRRRVHHARGPGRRTGAFASGVVGAFLEQAAAEHPFDDGPAHEARVLERDVVVAGDLVLPPHTGRRRGGGAGVGGPGRAAALGGLAGGADGRGFTFGEDVEVIDGVEVHFERRYKVGDIMTVWDDGVVIEKHVSNVKITEQEDGRMRTVTTFGDAITVGDGWERVLKKVQTIFGSIRAIANST